MDWGDKINKHVKQSRANRKVQQKVQRQEDRAQKRLQEQIAIQNAAHLKFRKKYSLVVAQQLGVEEMLKQIRSQIWKIGKIKIEQNPETGSITVSLFFIHLLFHPTDWVSKGSGEDFHDEWYPAYVSEEKVSLDVVVTAEANYFTLELKTGGKSLFAANNFTGIPEAQGWLFQEMMAHDGGREEGSYRDIRESHHNEVREKLDTEKSLNEGCTPLSSVFWKLIALELEYM